MEKEEETETVYKNTGSEENHIVMNERVQALAGSIYEEFEQMISKYDPDVVKNLMPLMVNVLESLDLAYTESQEMEVEVELLKEDNEQLVTQYEREKQLRKCSEQKNLEIEDHFEGERKELNIKLDSLSSILKMFELKAKNSQDQIGRLEDKENEMKKEYNKLHERYTDLFKTHMDYMERSKVLGSERMEVGSARNRLPNMSLNQLNRSSGPVSYGYSELENNNEISISCEGGLQTPNVEYSSTSIKKELKSPAEGAGKGSRPRRMVDKGQVTEDIIAQNPQYRDTAAYAHNTAAVNPPNDTSEGSTAHEGEEAPSLVITGTRGWVDPMSPETDDPSTEVIEDVSQDPSIGPATPMSPSNPITCTSHTKAEKRLGNNLYQELSFQDTEVLGEVDEGADLTDSDNEDGISYRSYDNGYKTELRNMRLKGIVALRSMGKEVENLIQENNELLATKHALNIVKDDLIAKVDELTGEHEILREEVRSLQVVRAKLQARVQELEEEIKTSKQEEKGKKEKEEEAEDVPMAQRKRFTRVEMARVLMERNQYKERFMELQEAVRWTEMIRASKTTDPQMDKKSNKGIWKFFSNLFSGAERPNDPLSPYLNMKYSNSDENLGPLSTMRNRSSAERKAVTRGTDLFDGDAVPSDKLTARRAQERKEQYKQVRAHVKKDDGRLQAYGWSLPAKTPAAGPKPEQDYSSRTSVPVPVPVYCRPLMEKEPGMKIWCSAGVNLTGGITKDGGEIVGASVFYSSPPESETKQIGQDEDEISKLDAELKEGQNITQESEKAEQQLSSLVWICTSTHSISKVTVIDANNPADVLESFHVCSSHLLCIASVPGAKEDDYTVDPELNKVIVEESAREAGQADDDVEETLKENPEVNSTIGSISFVSCGTGDDSLEHPLHDETEEGKPRLTRERAVESGRHSLDRRPDVYKMEENLDTLPFISYNTLSISKDLDSPEERVARTESDAVHRRLSGKQEVSAKVKDGLAEVSKENELAYSEVTKMSSLLPTMWLGSQSGSIYVHSAVSQWKHCIHSIRLKDSVLSIVHVRGRVLAALADGTVAIFQRDTEGQWDLRNYYLLDLGKPHHSIRCMVQVHSKVWLGYRNRINVIDPRLMCVEASFDAHPRKESQVRQMAWVGDGVWVSIRLDSTLRLYHAHTHEHLQDVDIEPYVSKMLGTGKLGFSFVRITALMVSCTRLWLGTGNGVIISVPLSAPEVGKSSSGNLIEDVIEKSKPGAVVRVYADTKERVTPGTFIPYCSMAQAQLSFHGHRDAVKFFVSVPGHGGLSVGGGEQEQVDSMLVMSGGEGYIDFRLVEDGTEHDFDSHIMVWHLTGGSGSESPAARSIPSLASSAASLRPASASSSSIELGPTPGSGVGLDSPAQSSIGEEDEDESDAETVQPDGAGSSSVASRRSSSFRLTAQQPEIETATDPLQWNREVESMINNPPQDTFKSFHLSAEPSLSSWVIPQEAQQQPKEDIVKQPLAPSLNMHAIPEHQAVPQSSTRTSRSASVFSSKSSSSSPRREPLEDFTQLPAN